MLFLPFSRRGGRIGLPYPFHLTRGTSFPGSLILYTTRDTTAANGETKKAPIRRPGPKAVIGLCDNRQHLEVLRIHIQPSPDKKDTTGNGGLTGFMVDIKIPQGGKPSGVSFMREGAETQEYLSCTSSLRPLPIIRETRM